ncbi:MAG: bacteriohemerythrin [Deltaproteobacteria bacterium]|nr:bacteriohemerythrin [Deltaproteobacteria bacterium]
MAKLEWTKKFDTGIEVIDSQHKRIMNYINQLEDLRIVHPLRPDPEVGRVIGELVDYTMSHFAFEESLMDEAGYEFLIAHKTVHTNFTLRIDEFHDRYKNGENIAHELHALLVSWLVNHIITDDANYAPTVTQFLEKREKAKNSGWIATKLRGFFGAK